MSGASLSLREVSKKQKRLIDESNPCLKEQGLTVACLNENNYDTSKCEAQHENFKQCKAFWNFVRAKRLEQGIEPILPPPEEREEVKQREKFNFIRSQQSWFGM